MHHILYYNCTILLYYTIVIIVILYRHSHDVLEACLDSVPSLGWADALRHWYSTHEKSHERLMFELNTLTPMDLISYYRHSCFIYSFIFYLYYLYIIYAVIYSKTY